VLKTEPRFLTDNQSWGKSVTNIFAI